MFGELCAHFIHYSPEIQPSGPLVTVERLNVQICSWKCLTCLSDDDQVLGTFSLAVLGKRVSTTQQKTDHYYHY